MTRSMTGYTILDATGFADLVGALCLNDHVRLAGSNAEPTKRATHRRAWGALPHAAVVQAEMRGLPHEVCTDAQQNSPLAAETGRRPGIAINRLALVERTGRRELRRVQYEALIEVARAGRTRFHVNLLLRCTITRPPCGADCGAERKSRADQGRFCRDLLPDLMHVLARELTDTRASDRRGSSPIAVYCDRSWSDEHCLRRRVHEGRFPPKGNEHIAGIRQCWHRTRVHSDHTRAPYQLVALEALSMIALQIAAGICLAAAWRSPRPGSGASGASKQQAGLRRAREPCWQSPSLRRRDGLPRGADRAVDLRLEGLLLFAEKLREIETGAGGRTIRGIHRKR